MLNCCTNKGISPLPIRFSVTVTSPTPPAPRDVSGGSVQVDDNGDGTWHVWSYDSITAISFRDGK